MAFDPITAVLNIGNSIIDRLLPDKQANEAAKAAMLQMQLQGEFAQLQGQLEINKAEAVSQSVFVAGWRPGVGWCCVIALASDFVVRPFATWIAALLGHPIAYPPLDLSELLPLLTGLLGLGAMRSYDKSQGTGNGH
jgi:hypothetical protein